LFTSKIPNKNTDQVKKCQSQSVTKKWGISGSKFGISKQNTLRKSNKIFETDRKRPIALIKNTNIKMIFLNKNTDRPSKLISEKGIKNIRILSPRISEFHYVKKADNP
jgi:hypothetical protein